MSKSNICLVFGVSGGQERSRNIDGHRENSFGLRELQWLEYDDEWLDSKSLSIGADSRRNAGEDPPSHISDQETFDTQTAVQHHWNHGSRRGMPLSYRYPNRQIQGPAKGPKLPDSDMSETGPEASLESP